MGRLVWMATPSRVLLPMKISISKPLPCELIRISELSSASARRPISSGGRSRRICIFTGSPAPVRSVFIPQVSLLLPEHLIQYLHESPLSSRHEVYVLRLALRFPLWMTAPFFAGSEKSVEINTFPNINVTGVVLLSFLS